MLISFSPFRKIIIEGKEVFPLKIKQLSMHPFWRLLVLPSAGSLILRVQDSASKNSGMRKTRLYAESHRVQTGENSPGEKLAGDWNVCSFLIFNVFHHHYCCQSSLSIKLHKIQTLGNKHQCLSAYVKSQFFLYSNFTWKLLLVRCTLQLSPALQAAHGSAAPAPCQRQRDKISALPPPRHELPGPQSLQAAFILSWAFVPVDKEFICTYSAAVSTIFFPPLLATTNL